jgi:hypothetical protein
MSESRSWVYRAASDGDQTTVVRGRPDLLATPSLEWGQVEYRTSTWRTDTPLMSRPILTAAAVGWHWRGSSRRFWNGLLTLDPQDAPVVDSETGSPAASLLRFHSQSALGGPKYLWLMGNLSAGRKLARHLRRTISRLIYHTCSRPGLACLSATNRSKKIHRKVGSVTQEAA